MGLDVVIAFFILGFIAQLLKSGLELPTGLYQGLSIFLMLAIGLKGGIALSEHAAPELLTQSLGVVTLGLLLPVIAFPMLYWIGQMSRADSASIAAHYGSVSVGTYAVAVAVLESQGIEYEAYFPVFVVLLEMPAIVIGLAMARRSGEAMEWSKLLHEMFCNPGVLLMTGGLIIGATFGARTDSITPLFIGLFHGALALFLLEMGLVAARKIGDLRRAAPFLSAFGVLMPLIGAGLGGLLGVAVEFSTGGIILLSVLGASASYIAVPAVMRMALPEANHGVSIAASLAITFPFNVLVGIPLYVVFGEWLVSRFY